MDIAQEKFAVPQSKEDLEVTQGVPGWYWCAGKCGSFADADCTAFLPACKDCCFGKTPK
jgi:hypothetical protein